MSKAIFIDTSVCTGCRACQVACKQWKNLPAESTTNQGNFQNPQDLSSITYKLVRMKEVEIDGKLQWLFFPDQCRHCIEPPCLETARDESAIFKDEYTGAVIYTANTKAFDPGEIKFSCPYDIPRAEENVGLFKCDLCYDRIMNGLLPACVKTCPTGAMNFGGREEMLEMAEKRLETVKKRFPQAALLDKDSVSVIYLVTYDPLLYHDAAIASNSRGITRFMALRKMTSPLRRFASVLG